MLSNNAVPYEYDKFRTSVINGEIPVNLHISQQMNRIDDDIANPDYYYDPEAIAGYVKFCEEELTLTDGGDLKLLPSFKLWAEDLLAWYEFVEEKEYNPIKKRYELVRKKRRLRNKQYLIVARGAAKSVYQETVQAYGLIVDPETTVQITTAPTIRQSEEVMAPLRTAIVRSRGPLFNMLSMGSNKSRSNRNKSLLFSSKKGIENLTTNSILEQRPMSIDKLQGARPKYSTVDEWLSGNVKEDVIEALEQGASKAIDDYIIVAVSSEGTVRDSIGDSIKMDLLNILRGDVIDPHTSIFYYRLDDLKEVGDPDMWLKANPNIGATVSYSTYQKAVLTAESNGAKRNDILAKRFGIPVEGFTYFFTYEETALHSQQNFDGLECAMGMDASQGDDFWAFTWIFMIGGYKVGVKTRSYISSNKYSKLPPASKLKYDQLIDEGTLIVFEGITLDWVQVYEDVDNFIIEHDYGVLAFGYDVYNAKEFVEKWCNENGDMGVSKVIQGAKTESVPLGELKALAETRNLIFDEELMKYAMGNAVVIQDNNGNYKLSKKRQSEKIDNVSSLMDAWVAYTRNKEAFM